MGKLREASPLVDIFLTGFETAKIIVCQQRDHRVASRTIQTSRFVNLSFMKQLALSA
jgi:hypothetical protein